MALRMAKIMSFYLEVIDPSLLARILEMVHRAFSPGSVAIITGGAAGIGLAAAVQFVKMGTRVCIADLGEDRLAKAGEIIGAAASEGMTRPSESCANAGWMVWKGRRSGLRQL